jgi:hypothetical protein
VPDYPIAARIAHPLGETEGLDQPVHCRADVGVQKIGNDLRVGIVQWYGSNFTASQAGGLLASSHARGPPHQQPAAPP